MGLQLNLSATVTLGKEESGHWKEVALVEKLKQEWMYALTAKKKKTPLYRSGRSREVDVSGGSGVTNFY